MKLLLCLALAFILLLVCSCDSLDIFEDFVPTDTPTTTLPTPVETGLVATTEDTPTPSTSPDTEYPTDTIAPSETGVAPDTNPADNIQAEVKRFAGSGVSFNYPAKWEKIDDPDSIAIFRERTTGAFIRIAVIDVGYYSTRSDMETYQDAWVDGAMGMARYQNLVQSYQAGYEYETVFEQDDALGRLVSFSVREKIYDFSFTAPPDSYDQLNKDFNILISSFTF